MRPDILSHRVIWRPNEDSPGEEEERIQVKLPNDNLFPKQCHERERELALA